MLRKQEERPARPCLLARVSTIEQAEGYSIDEQVRDCRAWAEKTLGVTIADGDIFAEEGVSGTLPLTRRTGLVAALDGCQQGIYTHVIVHKVDRLGRNMEVNVTALGTMDKLGITFVAVKQGLSTDQLGNRLFVNLLSVFAEWFSANLADEVKKGMAGRRAEGLHNGPVPFGYVRLPESKVMQPHVDDAAIVKHIFQLYASGLSYQDVADQLNAEGHRMYGRLFHRHSIMVIIKNRAYMGLIRDSNDWRPGQHTAIITEELWQQAQAALARRHAMPRPIPGHSRPHVFSGGLAQCADCLARGHKCSMVIKESGIDAKHPATYECWGKNKRNGCEQRRVQEKHLADQMGLILAQFALPAIEQERLIALYLAEQSTQKTRDFAQDIRRLEQQKIRQAEVYQLGDWDRKKYLAERANVDAQLAELLRLQALMQPEQQLMDISNYVADIAMAWEKANTENRQELARLLFDVVYVHDRRIVGVVPSMHFRTFFSLAGDMVNSAYSTYQVPLPLYIRDALPSGVLFPCILYQFPTHRLERDNSDVLAMRRSGMSYREIQTQTGISIGTLSRIFANQQH